MADVDRVEALDIDLGEGTNAQFEIIKLTEVEKQECAEERLKLKRYVELMHTLLPELGVDLENLGKQDEQVEQREEEQEKLHEDVLQDIEKAEEALQKQKLALEMDMVMQNQTCLLWQEEMEMEQVDQGEEQEEDESNVVA